MNIIERIQHILNWVKSLFQSIPAELREYAAIALQVTGKIKAVIDSGVVVTIIELTPTDIDDNIREKLSQCLAILTQWLEVETLEQAIEAMKLMPKKLQNATLIKLASEITACLDNSELKENQYDIAVQAVYSSQHTA